LASIFRKREVTDPEVAAFIAGQPTYLFQEPAWGQVVGTLGFPMAYYCLEEDGRIVLAHLAARVRLGFFHLLCGGLPYGFAAGDVSRHDEFLRLLADAAQAEGIHRIRLSRNFYDPPLSPEGYVVREHIQQVLHLAGRGEDEVWDSLKGRVRRDIRLAERRGVVVESATDAAARDILFEMYCQTMARNETYVVWQRSMIEKMWELIIQPGQGEMLIGRHEGEPLAGMVTFYSGRRCFYFLGASSGTKRNLCPNDAVIWEAIRRALARGCEDFDFMICSRSDQHLIDFKAKWGTTSYPFRFYEKDLRWLPCRLWNIAFAVARTKVGGAVLRKLRRKGT